MTSRREKQLRKKAEKFWLKRNIPFEGLDHGVIGEVVAFALEHEKSLLKKLRKEVVYWSDIGRVIYEEDMERVFFGEKRPAVELTDRDLFGIEAEKGKKNG